MTRYGTGYRNNPNRPARPSFSAHPIAQTALIGSESVSISRFVPWMFDQDGTGACTMHARAKQLVCSAAAQGRPLPFIPSPANGYRVTGCLERPDWTQPLKDNGRDPIDTLIAVQKWGVSAMTPLPNRFSDADPATINDNPKLDELVTDSGLRLFGDYLITATGQDRIAQYCAALRAGLAVCFDVPGGDASWQQYSGGIIRNNPMAPRDHYVVGLGFGIDDAGNVVIFGHNSWGAWGAVDPALDSLGAFYCDADTLLQAADVIVSPAKVTP